MAFETYTASGKVGTLALPLAVGAGLVAGGAGAWLYQLIIDKVPFIYLNFIATAGFGGLIGLAVGFGAVSGHCRNLALAIAVTVLCCVGGTALSFKFAYDRRMAEEFADIPDDLTSEAVELMIAANKMSDVEEKFFRAAAAAKGDLDKFKEGFPPGSFIEMRADEGWSVGRSGGLPINGIFTYLIWLLELGVVVGVGGVITASMASTPYNEERGLWMDGDALALFLRVDDDALRTAARQGDAAALLAPQKKERGRVDAEYTVFTCEGSDHCYLSVELKWKEGSGKKEEDKSEEIVTHARFTPEEIDTLKANVG